MEGLQTMEIRLIAIDLDGTLLTSQKNIAPQTARILRKVRKHRRMHVVLCTARPPRTTLPFYRQLQLDDPMINYNGALVWSPPSGQVLLHRPIPVKFARAVITWARQRFADVRVSAEIGDKWYTDFYDGTYQTETAKTHSPDLVAPFEEWLTRPLTKLLLLGKPDWLTAVNQAIREDLAEELTTVQTEDDLLQIMHKSVSKVAALKTVAAALDVPQEQVMAIGDNANDAGMIQWAGLGVAMANAHAVCLKVADHVADHHDADGVANVVRDLVILGQEPHGL